MKKSNIVLIAIIGIVVVALLWGVGTRNTLVSMSEEIKSEAAQVGVELQRRSDLIPNAVATVKGLTAHEEGVYTEIADARTKLSGAIDKGNVSEIDAASSELESAFSRLLVIVENYPELKANESFTALQDQLEGTENRIKQARKKYNKIVEKYNKTIKMFPENIIAGMCGLTEAEYFEVSEEAKEVPVVDFNV